MAKSKASSSDTGAIKQESVDLKFAGVSDYYIDIAKACGYKTVRDAICESIYSLFRNI